jgi:lysozyme family protein
MTFTFDAYFEWLVPWEGSAYENVPGDPGGPTKYGIDQRSHPTVNIRSLTKEQAKEIYRREYWAAIAGDKLPPRTAWAMMDSGVNCGRTTAARWLQTVLGVTVDGRIGPITLAAAAKADDAGLAASILDIRQRHYRALGAKPNFKKFLNGWLNRNSSLRDKLV